MQYNKELFVDVIIPISIDIIFTYQVPFEYANELEVGRRVLVPFGKKKKVIGVIVSCHANKPNIKIIKYIDSVLDKEKLFLSEHLSFYKWISSYYFYPLGGVLKTAMFVEFKKNILISHSIDRYFKLNQKYTLELALKEVSAKKKSPAQEAFLQFFFKGNHKNYAYSDVIKNNFSYTILKNLIVKKIIILYDEIRKTNYNKFPIHLNELNKDQLQVFNSITNSFVEKKPILLHGVTGSGKTEVYKHLIQKSILLNQSVLYLLPEIALTHQMFYRLKSSFGDRVIVYHSSLSEKKKKEVWDVILDSGNNVLVLGTRSSLFLPFKNLGLIIVDEEHDQSYKQTIKAPFYHARDSAIVLAKLLSINILLGSATPSIESYYNTTLGKYILYELKFRFGNVDMPEVNLLDLTLIKKEKLIDGFLSSDFLNKIKLSISNGRQVMLFINRRGSYSSQNCHSCGHVSQCHYCDISLTFHRSNNKLICHYCGFKKNLTIVCEQCGSHKIILKGEGTEKIESTLSRFFHKSKINRMDFDSTRKEGEYRSIIEDFENHKVDILVGTQMLSKGLDFSNVGLVGVISADSLFCYPEFRCNERAFQLLSQVSGRSGRGASGEVVMQSYNVSHKTFTYVKDNNYSAFYSDEILNRKKYNYPPFSRLICITLKCKNILLLNNASFLYAKLLKDKFNVSFLGPEFPVKMKLANFNFKSIYIKMNKTKSISQMRNLLLSCNSYVSSQFKSVSIVVDVDSY